jgi:hypothetical protein
MTPTEKNVIPFREATHELQVTTTSTDAHLVKFPPEDPTIEQRMRLMESSGTLEFWNRPEEDGYTCGDGEPV